MRSDRYYMMWQESEDTSIEDNLGMALKHFNNKYKCNPEHILVNSEISLRTYKGIPLSKSKLVYTKGIVMMEMPNNANVNESNDIDFPNIEVEEKVATVVQPDVTTTQAVKRGRGRPRKNPLPDPNAPKRKRGRPRKISQE